MVIFDFYDLSISDLRSWGASAMAVCPMSVEEPCTLPYRPDMPEDDPLRLTKTMEQWVAGKVVRHANGCITVPHCRFRLPDGRRLWLKRYMYMRCVSDTSEGYIKSTCPPRSDGRLCVAPNHFVRKRRKRGPKTMPLSLRKKAAGKCKKHGAASKDGRFSDLPAITHDPARSKCVYVFDKSSTPQAPVLLDCFGVLDTGGDACHIWTRGPEGEVSP